MAAPYPLLGMYRTPDVRVGSVLHCGARRRDVAVAGFTRARIPWPVGPHKSPILCGGLAEAVRRESGRAVCYWFGASPPVVSRWRKALGVGFGTEGTAELAGRPKSQQTRARMSAAHRERAKMFNPNGRPWTVEEDEFVRALTPAEAVARTGRTADSVYCRRVRLGLTGATRWTAAEDEMVRTLPAPEAARRTGRALGSVYNRRCRLRRAAAQRG